MWHCNLQVEYFSFDEQISCFETVKRAMIAKIGKEAAEETVNAAMFQIGLGTSFAFDSLREDVRAYGLIMRIID